MHLKPDGALVVSCMVLGQTLHPPPHVYKESAQGRPLVSEPGGGNEVVGGDEWNRGVGSHGLPVVTRAQTSMRLLSATCAQAKKQTSKYLALALGNLVHGEPEYGHYWLLRRHAYGAAVTTDGHRAT